MRGRRLRDAVTRPASGRGLRSLGWLARFRPGRLLLVGLLGLLPGGALPLAADAAEDATQGPATCRNQSFEGTDYAVCTVQAGADLQLFLTAPDGVAVGSFERLRDMAGAAGKRVVFAMNAGMYHPDRKPVGLYVAEGTEQASLVTAGSRGNFGLLPNGVFCFDAEGFRVQETRAFAAAGPECRFATQSGPMLVIDGALHPRFLPNSDSTYVRNGVGVSADGQTAYFVISNQPVNFYSFARFFRDGLGTPQALYFDGSISRIFAPELGRNEGGRPMGPIIALLAPAG